jgi:peptidoglycan/LPS O-acetylase OafA/YrhL
LAIYQLAFGVANLAVLVGAGSLVVRFRRARGGERQQLRWVALAAALALLGSVVVLAAVPLGTSPVLLGWVAGVYIAIVPLAIGAAILRYRLYDLDHIISRTLAYGLLTLLLGGGYAAVVLGLGQLLGRDSPLVVAAATLAVAALFGPARRRIQAAVDRRFNRRKYNAAKTIETFSARLRDQVDLDTLTTELLTVTDKTMQPMTVSVWLRPPDEVAEAHAPRWDY